MGWKGTLRSMNAAAKRASREAERRHKAAVKQQQIEDAANAVESWEDYISDLISVHVDLADAIDWKSMATKKPPKAPLKQNTHQTAAQNKLDRFKPSMFDFLSGGSDKKKAKLVDAVTEGASKDDKAFAKAQKEHKEAFEDWEQDTKLAKRLNDGDVSAIKEVIEEFQSLTETDLIGSAVSFQINDKYIHAIPEVYGDDIVPNFRRKQLASGKLSETKMPAGQFNELYQDYVASVALKVAGDLFHILPIEEVYVTCVTPMLNSATGHMEKTPILSVQAMKRTYQDLNLEHIDPSDSLRNFVHNMKFRKTKGFEPVEPLQPINEAT